MPISPSVRVIACPVLTSAPVARNALATNSNGVFTLARRTPGPKNSGADNNAHDLAQVAVRLLESLRGAVDERLRRRVADEALGELEGDVLRGGRVMRKD